MTSNLVKFEVFLLYLRDGNKVVKNDEIICIKYPLKMEIEI